MSRDLDDTHDPDLESFLASAQKSAFPIQNLPFGVFRRAGTDEAFRGCVAIGDQVVDLLAVQASGGLGSADDALALTVGETLNPFMDAGSEASGALRRALVSALRKGSTREEQLRGCLVAMSAAEFALPARVGDYTDFYTSVHHATNIGRLFRPDNPLLPNYKWIPIGYHGRSSSVIVSGAPIPRPRGQKRPSDGAPPFGLSSRLDYELELGVYIGRGNALGTPIGIGDAEDHAFGVSLLNDWSARDIQAWEYQPLGPFLGKNFATSVSPFIVTMEALAPFRSGFSRNADDPQPLAYLTSNENSSAGALDISLEVELTTTRSRAEGSAPFSLGKSSYGHAYWTLAQMITHHTVNGCNLRAGDLLGTGTLSGPDAGSEGALIELTKSGREPITLPNGETRSFLEDGDEVILRGHCEREGFARIGLGEVRGRIVG